MPVRPFVCLVSKRTNDRHDFVTAENPNTLVFAISGIRIVPKFEKGSAETRYEPEEDTNWRFFVRLIAISPKRCKMGPMLLLIAKRNVHTRLRFVPKSVTLVDLELTLNGHYALRLYSTHMSFGAHH